MLLKYISWIHDMCHRRRNWGDLPNILSSRPYYHSYTMHMQCRSPRSQSILHLALPKRNCLLRLIMYIHVYLIICCMSRKSLTIWGLPTAQMKCQVPLPNYKRCTCTLALTVLCLQRFIASKLMSICLQQFIASKLMSIPFTFLQRSVVKNWYRSFFFDHGHEQIRIPRRYK